ncbi:MAG: membrane protein insertion efficiency factor YidD [Patescibacteria group bacterium]|nr:membrane protein insertion efficiency factor YidD [Patescibacteria group bacterium]
MKIRNIIRIILFPIEKITILAILIYQKIFSLEHSFWGSKLNYRVCRHFPSCSEYAKIAIQKFGLLKGGSLAIARLCKCHPWSKLEMNDPVPNS